MKIGQDYSGGACSLITPARSGEVHLARTITVAPGVKVTRCVPLGSAAEIRRCVHIAGMIKVLRTIDRLVRQILEYFAFCVQASGSDVYDFQSGYFFLTPAILARNTNK